jgi:hypothetical protein
VNSLARSTDPTQAISPRQSMFYTVDPHVVVLAIEDFRLELPIPDGLSYDEIFALRHSREDGEIPPPMTIPDGPSPRTRSVLWAFCCKLRDAEEKLRRLRNDHSPEGDQLRRDHMTSRLRYFSTQQLQDEVARRMS